MKIQQPAQNGVNETGPQQRQPPPTWQAWLETLALVAAFVAVGALIDLRDPFLLRRGFSWLTLAPLLAGLQYGSTHGLAGAAIQALALAIAWRSGITSVPDSVAESVLGWLIAGLLAGEFHDSWLRRAGQLEAFGDHVRARLESLGRAYLALKISHDRLQRAAPAKAATLRDALSAFRRELSERPGASLESVGDRILALFSEHAFVRAASLHAVDRKGRPGPAIARLGAGAEAVHDPLVRKAARTGLTVSVRDGGYGDEVLAAVPLVDVSCRALAVVAIRDMPFVALHAETLELLAVLGGRLGDSLAHAARAPTDPVPEAARSRPATEPAPGVAPVPARVEEAA
jgi:hypothetical protein